MNSKLPLIISDLDGTLCNTLDELLEQIWDALGIALCPEDVDQYDVAEALLPKLAGRLDRQSLRECLRQHVWYNPAVYRDERPYWSLHRAYQAFIRAGGGWTGCTARPDAQPIIDATTAWLHVWGYDGASVYFSSSYAGGKEQVVSEEIIPNLPVGTEVWYVDDSPEEAEAVAELFEELRPDGVNGTVYLVDRPWTRQHYGGLLKKRYVEQDIAERIEGR